MTRRALLVGINDYPGSPHRLNGCVNDITSVADVLVKHFAFDASNIVLLTDRGATRQAILDGMNTLIRKEARGDLLVLYYAGYGSQVGDSSGAQPGARLDEVLCPYDFDWNGTSIRDDDLADAIRAMPRGAWLEVFLDACHSGTGSREMILDRSSLSTMGPGPITESDLWSSSHCIRPRFLAPPAEIALRADPADGGPVPVRRVGTAAVERNVLWAACRDSQYSADADIGGTPSGAFTYFFCKHVRETGGQVAREELLRLIRDSLKREGFSQVPQLECGGDLKKAPVFQ